MKRYFPLVAFLIFTMFLVTGCDFLGGIFQTGVGVGIFIAVVIIVLIFFIARIGRKR